ncbi:MAG: hypothetical protein IT168_26440 [Bryobacterales bacterium]|nr:hypothetical protein [Bryobacterales bacterium]
MTFNHLNRRLHLYLALTLLPWFFLYGVSSIPFSHAPFFDQRDKAGGQPDWTKRFERAYDLEVPAEGDLRPIGAKIMADAGLQGAFGAYRQGPGQVNVYIYTFWKSTQLKYLIAEKKLVAEDRRFRWDHFLTGAHAKGGFEQGGLHDLWGVVVDLVCLGMLVWVATGLFMWWKLPSTRRWGWLALIAGLLTFGTFVFTL